jgi:hypothetical protein
MFKLNLYLTLKKHKGDIKKNAYEHRTEQPSFKVENQAWFRQQHIKTTRPSERLDHQRISPFLIVKQIIVMAFELKLPGFMKIHLVFHVSLLELYHSFAILRRIHDPPPPIEVDNEHEYEMKDILDSRIFNHQLQYIVH